jgi:hypothetical protein
VRHRDLNTPYRIDTPTARPFDSIHSSASCGSESPDFVPKPANRISCSAFRGSFFLTGQRWDINKNKFWDELITCFPWYYTNCIERGISNNSSIVAYVFVAAETF